MKNKIAIYLLGWIVYISFSLLFFPTLSIPTLQGSFFLAILGGWLFSYHGAWLTVLLTIPYHFMILSVYADPLITIKETFNPLGIGTQIFLSFCTTYLKQQKIRYNLLNSSLEKIVTERTSELVMLNDYLQRLQHEEQLNICNALLSKPVEDLYNILLLSFKLDQQLENTFHYKTKIDTIQTSLQQCIQSLENVGSFWSTDSSGPGNNFEALLIFRENFLKNSAVDIQISNEVLWDHFTKDIFIYIHQIISEAVTNALRHAQAEHIEIGIRKTDAAVIVFIENDGKPLPPEFDEGMGLPLMRYRASKIGAKLSISRCENNNTRVECTLPAG